MGETFCQGTEIEKSKQRYGEATTPKGRRVGENLHQLFPLTYYLYKQLL